MASTGRANEVYTTDEAFADAFGSLACLADTLPKLKRIEHAVELVHLLECLLAAHARGAQSNAGELLARKASLMLRANWLRDGKATLRVDSVRSLVGAQVRHAPNPIAALRTLVSGVWHLALHSGALPSLPDQRSNANSDSLDADSDTDAIAAGKADVLEYGSLNATTLPLFYDAAFLELCRQHQHIKGNVEYIQAMR